jgi:predicted transcriptional regulator YdeE
MEQSAQFRDLEMRPAIGIAAMLTKSQSKNFTIILQLWKRFNKEMHAIENGPRMGNQWEKFGITYRYDNAYWYLTGIPYTSEMLFPDHMLQKQIPAGRYACFTHTGPMYHLKTTIHAIYTTHLPILGLERPTPEEAGLFHFERYDARFHWNRADSCIDIYVPLTLSQR